MATYYVDGAVGSDSNAGTSPGAGNAWLTIAHALSTMANGDIVYVKASVVYSVSSTLTLANSAYTDPSRVIGYTSSITDHGQVTVKITAAVDGFTITGNGGSFENFIADANGNGGANKGFISGAAFSGYFINCTASGSGGWNYGFQGSAAIVNSLIGCKSSGNVIGIVALASPVSLLGCSVVSNTTYGLYSTGPFSANRCLIANNTTIGINIAGNGSITIVNNDIYGNGGDGILASSTLEAAIFNNVITGNGGYGINWPAAYSSCLCNYNFFFNNTSGARNNLTASPNDVTLTGDPYTNAAGNDFTLNNTAGAGAAVRAAGFPGAMLVGGTGYMDGGALQHQDSGGGASGFLGQIVKVASIGTY